MKILSYLFPRDLLALARSCKQFFQILVDPTASLLWRRARARFEHPVPEPSSNWSEWAYAAFIFDSGECDICQQYVDEPYTSFSLRARVCSSCHPKWQKALKRVDTTGYPSFAVQYMLTIPRKEKSVDTPHVFLDGR